MLPPFDHAPLQTPHAPPLPGEAELVALALRLRQLARAGALPRLLRGKNIGLLCDAAGSQDPAPLLRAAGELGAQVATVRWRTSTVSGASDDGKPHDVQHTGRMLGRLYDAVVCQGMPSALVRQIAQAAGVPVYDDIAADAHPSALLAQGLGEEAMPGDNRRFVLQALLVDGLA
jgi:ornithine carbamoyltransferase